LVVLQGLVEVVLEKAVVVVVLMGLLVQVEQVVQTSTSYPRSLLMLVCLVVKVEAEVGESAAEQAVLVEQELMALIPLNLTRVMEQEVMVQQVLSQLVMLVVLEVLVATAAERQVFV
tara:strand:+ start:405 stop:755 length:351 start_codon:yes stop_codon:yes gene_type:complete